MKRTPCLVSLAVPLLLVAMAAPLPAQGTDLPGDGATVAEGAEVPDAGNQDIIATVNGEPVFAEDIESRLQSLHSAADPESSAGGMDMDRLMTMVVNDMLLGQEARTLGLHEEVAIVDKVAAYRDGLMIDALTRDAVARRAKPTDEEIDALCHDRHRAVTLRVVTVYEEEDAIALRKQLDEGADMEALAREKSVDPYSLRGGLMDEIPDMDLQRDIAAVAFTLEPGEMAGPIRTDLGYSTIRVESFSEPDPEELARARPQCAQIVRMLKATDLKAELAAEARQRVSVATHAEVVASVVPEELPDGRLMPRAPDREGVVARIGDSEVVTVGEYTKALVKNWKGVRNRDAAVAAAPIVLNGLIERKILLVEARRLGYDQRPAIQRAVRAYETRLVVPRYLEEALAGSIEVTPEQIEAYYQAHRQEYNRPPRVRLGQITVADLADAERIVAQLRAGADLAWLAQRHSLDQYKNTAGDRGWYVPQPGVQDFNADLFTAEPGTVLDPVGMPGNYIILKVIAREEQGIYELEEISGNVRAQAERQAVLESLDKFMQKLRQRAEIVIDEDRLARLAVTGRSEQPQGMHGGDAGAMGDHGE